LSARFRNTFSLFGLKEGVTLSTTKTLQIGEHFHTFLVEVIELL
jgi:hypothetical protein